MGYITVIASDGRTFRRELDGDLLKIGRSSKNDLNLSFDLSLSRFHAEIRKNDSKFLVSDVGSRNGTSLNGKPVLEPLEMKIGDRMVKLVSWYDNEVGYSCRCVDLFKKMAAL